MNAEMGHDGRVSAALVTGVGSAEGIGFAIATELVRTGLRVAITATTSRVHERAAELGAGTVGFVADLRERDQARRLIADVHAAVGELDVLVNNAGMAQTG